MELVPGWVSDAGYASLSASRNDAHEASVWAKQKHSGDSALWFGRTGNARALASSYSSYQRCRSAPIPDDPHDSGQTHILPAIDMQRRQLLTYSSLFPFLVGFVVTPSRSANCATITPNAWKYLAPGSEISPVPLTKAMEIRRDQRNIQMFPAM